VADDYPAGDNAFTGTINWVRIDLGTDSHDHLIDPEQLFHFAMTRHQRRTRSVLTQHLKTNCRWRACRIYRAAY
jgi:hypothetical protein